MQEILKSIQDQAANVPPFGDTLKFVVDDKSIYIDGTGDTNTISFEDKDASCTIITDSDTLQKLQEGSLNPMNAVMTGKIKIKGNMGLAMKLQSLLQ